VMRKHLYPWRICQHFPVLTSVVQSRRLTQLYSEGKYRLEFKWLLFKAHQCRCLPSASPDGYAKHLPEAIPRLQISRRVSHRESKTFFKFWSARVCSLVVKHATAFGESTSSDGYECLTPTCSATLLLHYFAKVTLA
jgi:hypothetical protein